MFTIKTTFREKEIVAENRDTNSKLKNRDSYISQNRAGLLQSQLTVQLVDHLTSYSSNPSRTLQQTKNNQTDQCGYQTNHLANKLTIWLTS